MADDFINNHWREPRVIGNRIIHISQITPENWVVSLASHMRKAGGREMVLSQNLNNYSSSLQSHSACDTDSFLTVQLY